MSKITELIESALNPAPIVEARYSNAKRVEKEFLRKAGFRIHIDDDWIDEEGTLFIQPASGAGYKSKLSNKEGHALLLKLLKGEGYKLKSIKPLGKYAQFDDSPMSGNFKWTATLSEAIEEARVSPLDVKTYIELDRISGGWSVFGGVGRDSTNITGAIFSTKAAAKKEMAKIKTSLLSGMSVSDLGSEYWKKYHK